MNPQHLINDIHHIGKFIKQETETDKAIIANIESLKKFAASLLSRLEKLEDLKNESDLSSFESQSTEC